jgi:SAM-dependent methyltransferase
VLTRHYAKLCDLPDFSDPGLLEAAADILPERDPASHAERKVWEFAMLALFLADVDRLGEDTSALAVGAGNERILFWLANRIGRVVATDIYGEGSFAGKEAEATMLSDPAMSAPFPYREERLEVLWMDARELDFPDGSFDVVFSLSSIEHFGSPADIARAAAEAGRVLRPGGHAFVATDMLVRLHPLDTAPADFARRVVTLGRWCRGATPVRRSTLGEAFTAREVARRIVGPSGLELMQPLDDRVSEASWQNLTRLNPDGTLTPATGNYFPHAMLAVGRSALTSVALPLYKPAASSTAATTPSAVRP